MRNAVTIAIVAAALIVSVVMILNTRPAAPPIGAAPATQPSSNPSSVATTAPTTAPATQTADSTTTGPSAVESVGPTPTTQSASYRAVGATAGQPSTLGTATNKLRVQLTAWGAGVKLVELTDPQYTISATNKQPYVAQSVLDTVAPDGSKVTCYPFAARGIIINGQWVQLQFIAWKLVEPGVYQADIIDSADRSVARITRRYSFRDDLGQYTILCEQKVENLTTAPITVAWEQNGQGDLPSDDAAYMGDRRELVAGYHDLSYDPDYVFTKNTLLPRTKVIDGDAFWPNNNLPPKHALAWIAAVNRYFTAVVERPPVKAPAGPGFKAEPLDTLFPTIGKEVIGAPGKGRDDHRVMVFTLASKPVTIAAGGAASFDLAYFTGPRESKVFATEPYKSSRLDNLIVYTLGCTFCTFQPLAIGLLWCLKAIEFVVRDWGVAIIILVLVVRLLLHPITKRSQVNMMKMSKMMGSLQPELEKLKKKYKDDQASLNRETIALYRERGVNPANFLGCLPMFLQMPIWVALYAMLYFAIELRNQPAFYGVFQAISGGRWQFLGDLSSPDRFITLFPESRVAHLIFVTLDYSAINLLPILMAVVFYYQQKLSQPPTPPANEQAAQQQKMMKYMTLLFPVMLYSAPSGLTLYIMASTAAGIVDSIIVRRHIKREEEAGTLFKKKPPSKPGGLMDRMQKFAEAKQAQIMSRTQDPPRRKK